MSRIAIAAVLLAASSSACMGSKACSAIACLDQASFEIQRADGTAPGLEASLTIDGRTVNCPAPADRVSFAACDAGVTVTSRELQDCHEEQSLTGASSLSCKGTGRFVQDIQITGQPTMVGISLRSAGSVVAERAFQPTYTDSHPNGLGCDPVCHQAHETWTLP